MCRRSKVVHFLTLNSDWDPALIFVMASAVGINLLTFRYILNKKEKPVYCDSFSIPKNNKIDWKLVIGAAIFGTGYGLSGICPGPGMAVFPIYFPHTIVFITSLALG